VRVAQVGRVITGKTPPTNRPEYWNGDIPFVTPADLNDGVFAEHRAAFLVKDWASGEGDPTRSSGSELHWIHRQSRSN
jgi:hypothetical protein